MWNFSRVERGSNVSRIESTRMRVYSTRHSRRHRASGILTIATSAPIFVKSSRTTPSRGKLEAEVANIFSIKSPVEKLISREGESVCRGVWCGDWVELGSNSKLAKQLFLRYSPALRSAHRLQQPLQRWAIFVLVGGGMQNAETGRDLFDSWQFLKLMATKSTCCVVMQFKYRCYELEFQHLCYNFDFTLKFEKENFFWSVLWI